jgi:hypothetical protein
MVAGMFTKSPDKEDEIPKPVPWPVVNETPVEVTPTKIEEPKDY